MDQEGILELFRGVEILIESIPQRIILKTTSLSATQLFAEASFWASRLIDAYLEEDYHAELCFVRTVSSPAFARKLKQLQEIREFNFNQIPTQQNCTFIHFYGHTIEKFAMRSLNRNAAFQSLRYSIEALLFEKRAKKYI